MERAYSVLCVKSFDPTGRRFSGIATTPTPDRVDDIIDPLGVSFAKSMPLLLFHDSTMPVGTVFFGRPTADGIPFDAIIPDVTEAGEVKALTDKAAHFVKYGLIRAVSIGFRALNDAVKILKTGGRHFLKSEVLETSLVVIPANQEAVISVVKSIDLPYLPPASGTGQEAVARPSAGVSAQVNTRTPGSVRPMPKTIHEQIDSFNAQRQAKSARMTEIMQKASDEGVTLDPAQSTEYDDLSGEIEAIDKHLGRLDVMQKSVTVKPVVAATQAEATASRTGQVISVKANRPAGIGFARVALAKIMAPRNGTTIKEYIGERWPDDSELKAYFQKAAVPAGTTTNADWAGNLVDPTNLASEFLEFLRPQTLIGRLPGLKRVPFNVRFTGQATGAVANWVGQGKAKPVTSFSTLTGTLLYTKIAAIAVITEELARFSSPSAEALVRDELARAVIERMDVDFIDPAQAAVSNVSPASITNGVTPLSSAGTSEANIRTDIQNLLEQFILNNVSPNNLVLVMPNTLGLAASLLVNSLGQPSFPGLTMSGGTLMGIPVVTTQYAANQSGSGNLVIAINTSDIFLADDGNVTLDASREASIEMSDAPAHNSTTPTAASLVSMYQTNSIAIRAERYINWAKARTNAVSFIDDVNWGSVGSPS